MFTFAGDALGGSARGTEQLQRGTEQLQRGTEQLQRGTEQLQRDAEARYLAACDHAQLRGERWLNRARLAFASLGVALQIAAPDANSAQANTILRVQLVVWLLWAGVAAYALRRQPFAAPRWLASTGIAIDQLVLAATYVAVLGNYGGALEYWQGGVLEIFAVLNILNGLRLSPWACVQGGLWTLALNGALLAHTATLGLVPLATTSTFDGKAIYLPDAVFSIFVTVLPAFGVALVARLSRQLLLRAEHATAHRQAVREEYQQLAKYLPRQAIEVMMRDAGRRRLGGQQQTATILFVDIRNFTAMSERLQPEATVGVLNEFFAVMVEKLFAYDGTLDKFLGDGFMAVFGAPLPLPDSVTRAVVAAIDMAKATQTMAQFGGTPLAIGIGIATGPVLSGTVGSPDRMEFTCIGPPVNLASRLEGLNKRYETQILIDQATADALHPDIVRRDRGAVAVRGLTGQTPIWSIDLDAQDEAVLSQLRHQLVQPVAALEAPP